MSRHTTWAAVAAALMLVLAGCGAGVSPGSGSGGTGGADTATDGGEATAGGSVNFYISDQPSAIDDFEHLNVTVTEVVLVRADGEDDEETETEVETETRTETETESATETQDADDGERVVYQVPNITVDLTQLRGADAARLGSLPVANGTYTKVFIRVSAVDGTLKNGESVDVKLPSSKLQVNKRFTVGDGEEVDFVFDVSVFQRGTQGYIIRPVVGESGTGEEVEINEVADYAEDEQDERDDENENENGASETETGTETESENGADGADGAGESGEASMNFYLSDERNAMDDFRHLNVTVTKVGLHRAGNGSEDGWIERDVDDRTVDLTTLMGANATKLGTFGVANGTYDKVFVYVSAVDATLKNGESVRVKLPSSKLQLNTEFTVGDGEEVDFVYDMSVFKAGNSGKYILKPVVSQSGTGDEVEIDDVDDVDENDEAEEEADDDADAENGTDAAALEAAFVGNVTAGGNATVAVTQNGSALENATVRVTERVDGAASVTEYATDANGTVTFAVDANATELTVVVEGGDEAVELEREFESEDEESADADGAEQGSDDGTETTADGSAALRAGAL